MRRSGCESETRGGPSRSASNTASGCTAVSSGVQLYRSEWFHGFQNCRVISTGSQILERLGIKKIRLMPAPVHFNALSGFNLEVTECVQP